MWSCHKCGKPVYFAERKQSLGYDWHPECLRCEECAKRLNPGQHAEHKGVPYCHVPCYSALFGPTLFGHGSRVESHKSFGKIENRQGTPIPRSLLEAKLKIFNQFFDGKSQELKSRERNGKLILEGVLRIYWGVNNLIHLKEEDDQRTHVQVRKRNSYRAAINNGLENSSSSNYYTNTETIPEHTNGTICNNDSGDKVQADIKDKQDNGGTTLEMLPKKKQNLSNAENTNTMESNEKTNPSSKSVNEQGSSIVEAATSEVGKPTSPTSSTQKPAISVNALKKSSTEANEMPPVRIRKMASSRSKTKLKRRCSINGHYYNRETSVFTPPYGSASNVWVTSLVNSPEVINMLLDKFRVENNPHDFALFIVRDNGETRRIHDDEYPLLVRVILGPHEDVAKVFIMDKHKTNEISSEVAQFLNLTDTELRAIVKRYDEEEEREIKKIIRKFRELKHRIRLRMNELYKQQKLKENMQTS